MNSCFGKAGALYPFAILSMIGHLLCGSLFVGLGPLNFCAPVSPSQEINVTLKGPEIYSSHLTGKSGNEIKEAHHQTARSIVAAEKMSNDPAETETSRSELPSPAKESAPAGEAAPLPTVEQKDSAISQEGTEKVTAEMEVKKGPIAVSVPLPTGHELYKGPVRTAGEFLATKREKLTYRIGLLNIPVGTAVMEATNTDGELRITIRITSSGVLSSFYPVDDLVETRMIGGIYLLTRVRQKEGNYRGDFGFTLMLREHKAFWVNRLTNRYDYQTLPGDDVMDAVSGFYFLRNRDLEVGKEEKLNLFDSNEYSPTTVEVLRRERIELPGSREMDTLVLHPQFKTAGFFRRTGDIMIWVTDDEYKVPVRMETFITLGKVTAELISAESEQPISLPHRLSLSRR